MILVFDCRLQFLELQDSLDHMLSKELRPVVFEKFDVIVSVVFRIMFFILWRQACVFSS
jgi:hypothetical protein